MKIIEFNDNSRSYGLLSREIITHNGFTYYRYNTNRINNINILESWEYRSKLDSVNARQELDMYELEEIYQKMLRRLKLERILNENTKIR